jgi:hypothetical protein
MDMRRPIVVLVVLLGLSITWTAVRGQEPDAAPDEGQAFHSMDADGNGRVSWEEYSGRSAEQDMEEKMRLYQLLDKDSDGLLSLQEWSEGAGG